MCVCVCWGPGGGGGGGGQTMGVGLRRLDEGGVQIDRWRKVDNGSVGAKGNGGEG